MTAVQLRHDAELRCTLVGGDAFEIATGRLGPIALLGPRVVAGYFIEADASVQLVVFRTAPTPGLPVSKVPGVMPLVQVLLDVTGRRRTTRVRRVLQLLRRAHLPLERPSSMFWRRVAALAQARSPLRRNVTLELLEREGLGVVPSLPRRQRLRRCPSSPTTIGDDRHDSRPR
jgi:hypothetical protein